LLAVVDKADDESTALGVDERETYARTTRAAVVETAMIAPAL